MDKLSKDNKGTLRVLCTLSKLLKEYISLCKRKITENSLYNKISE